MSDPLMCSCGRQRVESGNDLCARCREDWERGQQQDLMMEEKFGGPIGTSDQYVTIEEHDD